MHLVGCIIRIYHDAPSPEPSNTYKLINKYIDVMSESRDIKGQKMAVTKCNALYTESLLQSQTLL